MNGSIFLLERLEAWITTVVFSYGEGNVKEPSSKFEIRHIRKVGSAGN